MKKIALISLVLFVFSSCGVFRPIREYENRLGYLYVKPSGVDTFTVSEKKTYALEGHLKDGTWAIFMVKGDVLKKIMAIKWPGGALTDGLYHGYGFTINDMGQKSYLTSEEIAGVGYDESQKAFLERNKNRRKFVIVSDLPYAAVGRMEDEKIVLVENTSPGTTAGSSTRQDLPTSMGGYTRPKK